MLCALILYMSGRTYNGKPIANHRFFEKLFMAILFYSHDFRRKAVESKSPKEIFFHILLLFVIPELRFEPLFVI